MSDIETVNGDELRDRQVFVDIIQSLFLEFLLFILFALTDRLDDDEDEDEVVDHDDGEHDIPYDATDVPLRLSANDPAEQREVEAAVYDHGIDVDRGEHVALFYESPVKTMPFRKLKHLWQQKDAQGALRLLSGRHRLEIEDDEMVDMSQSNVVPAVGPHFLDLVMYVGDRRGLDAVLPNQLVDHTWRCQLNFSGICRLWPDSKPTRLPFDNHGRMMYIGTRKEEQVWIAMVPNEWLVEDHPLNATGQWPRLADMTSAMSSKHALMLVMFFARAFDDMRLGDFTCRVDYPEPLSRRSVNEASDIL